MATEKNANFHIQLHSESLLSIPKNASAEISIQIQRKNERRQFIEKKHGVKINYSAQKTFNYPLSLPPGNYVAIIELKILNSLNAPAFCEISFDIPNLNSPFLLSDISLFNKSAGDYEAQLILSNEIDRTLGKLIVQSEIKASLGKIFTVRSVLYKKENTLGVVKAEKYVSVRQANQVIQLDAELKIIEEEFDIMNIEYGDYMIEIFIYDDQNMLGESSRSFSIKWPGMKIVYNNIEESISQLRYLATESQIENMLILENNSERTQAFTNFWSNLSGDQSDHSGISLPDYFSKIYMANQSFSEDLPGWTTERGRIFMLYGNPDEKKEIEESNNFYEVWYYNQWTLKFTFLKKDLNYLLITPVIKEMR